MGQAELEIRIRPRLATGYPIELRYSPDGEQDQVFPATGTAFAAIDPNALAGLLRKPLDYGKTLASMTFSDPELQKALSMVWGPVRGGAQLRVRLFIDHGAAALVDLNWETLCDPDGNPLFLGAKVWFSRYLSSELWQRVEVRAKRDLRALVVIANPNDLANLPPIDTASEVKRAQEHLSQVASVSFLGHGIPGAKAASVVNIGDALQGGVDFVYLIAHGAFSDAGQPKLWLEDDKTGATDFVVGDRFAQIIRNLPAAPRLVMLASCMSFASVDDEPEKVYSALGPQLAAAGVPAVVAMHGKVSQETIARFTPEFYKQLAADGQVDRAMSVARGQIADTQKDYWMPVLFLRLRSGSLWYPSGLGDPRSLNRSGSRSRMAARISQGRIVPSLCDRRSQEEGFKLCFHEHRRQHQGVPLLCIVHGEQGECHESLVERLTYAVEHASQRRTKTASRLKKVPWPYEGSSETRHRRLLHSLLEQLSPHEVQPEAELSAQEISKLVRDSKASVLAVLHEIRTSRWDEATPIQIERYAKLLENLDTTSDGPDLLVFISVIYSEPPPAGHWIPNWLDSWRRASRRKRVVSALQSHANSKTNSCCRLLLEELRPITQDDVLEWFHLHGIYDSEERRMDASESLFSAGGRRIAAKRMAEVESHLRQLHHQYLSERGSA